MYKTKYVWQDDGVCDIVHLWKGTTRRCMHCGKATRFLIALGKKRYSHLTCGIK